MSALILQAIYSLCKFLLNVYINATTLIQSLSLGLYFKAPETGTRSWDSAATALKYILVYTDTCRRLCVTSKLRCTHMADEHTIQ